MVFYRGLPKCDFTVNQTEGYILLRTEALELKYQMGQRFREETLSVKLLIDPASAYHYGEEFEDLGGTAKTLDFTSFACLVDHGVCSRNGFSVLDDSKTVVLDDDGSVGVRNDNTIDAYFFGYGFDYLGAVKDFYRITGAPPLLPAYALGNWWSHDIGGHMRGRHDDMRYIRWVQLGVFPPINRLHSSNMIFIFKENGSIPSPFAPLQASICGCVISCSRICTP